MRCKLSRSVGEENCAAKWREVQAKPWMNMTAGLEVLPADWAWSLVPSAEVRVRVCGGGILVGVISLYKSLKGERREGDYVKGVARDFGPFVG